MKNVWAIILLCITAASCKQEDVSPQGNLIFKFKFDSTQARLNNVGAPSVIPAGNAAQSPVFNKMSAHYIELTPTQWTPLGSGAVLYRAAETSVGGTNAIDFEKAFLAGNGEVFYTIPFRNIAAGDYEWLRVSLAYQNFDVKFYVDTVIAGTVIKQQFPGTGAGFIGFNTYIKNFQIKAQSTAVNANKKQGFWGFETAVTFGGTTFPYLTTGQAPEGSTTVVNPLFATSPIPAGSCVVTSAFAPGRLTITGKETADLVIEVSLSTNKSFEWRDLRPDGLWEPSKGEQVVDMGIRGMLATIK